MEILSYLKSLLPSFTRDRLEEDARETLAQLERSVIPSYQDASALTQHKLRSVAAKNLDTLFSRNTPNIDKGRGDHFVNTITDSLPKVLESQVAIQEIIEKKFDKDIVLGGVTIYKVNVIQLQEMCGFVTRYSAKLLNYLYIVEAQEVGGDDRYTKDSLSPGDIQWVESKFLDYCRALDTTSRGRKQLLEALSHLPEVLVGGNETTDEATISSLSPKQADPLGMTRVSGFSRSPIFHIRTFVAEYQINRYKEMAETKRVLELRALNLQRLIDQQPDAKLEKQIAYTQSRIDNYTSKMRKVEEELHD